MDPRLRDALSSFRTSYPGQEGEWKRLVGYLHDHAPDQLRAAIALGKVAKQNLHVELAHFSSDDHFSFDRYVNQLTGLETLPRGLAEQALLAWLAELGREPPDKSALLGPIDDDLLAASLDGIGCLHLAVPQASLPAMAQLRIENKTPRVLRNLDISVWLQGEDPRSGLTSTTWTGKLTRLLGHQVALLDSVHPRVGSHALQNAAAGSANWWIEVRVGDDVVLRTFQPVNVLPPHRWLMGLAPPPVLAAFVLPQSPVVSELVAEAAARVDVGDPRPGSIKAHEALARLLAELDLAAPGRPRDEVFGPQTIVARARASPVEYQLLLAACLEYGGMPPLLLWTNTGPALGLWCCDDKPSLVDTDDPLMIARLAESHAMRIVPVGNHVVQLSEQNGDSFCALDLGNVRAWVSPLRLEALEEKSLPPLGNSPAERRRQQLLDRAALGAAPSGLRVPGAWAAQLRLRPVLAEEIPERVQHWERRLLNLTLVNPLLNLKNRITTLPLLVSDLGGLEDRLASGESFDLIPRPPASQPGQPVPPVTPQMMDRAVRNRTLIVDLPEKRLHRGAKTALRSSQTAENEGGVHTLFLALGILRWMERGQSGEERLAPLLMVPVELSRSGDDRYHISSAKGDTEFNAALIEYLRRKFSLVLPGLYPLPTDHAGVDVPGILDRLRTALAGVPATAGWHVEEGCQIGILSFSGYRMWRDLDQRAADLLRHPLVKQLALRAEEREPVEFPLASKLDDDWDPREIFCPLEADSSQLVAIRSAAEGLSFALEGPPGTGKSQTIANLICHCLAIGKTVLFVSQKRAALEVVQAKLEGLGLGPFSLDLHSHKASRREFIGQLKGAADFHAPRPRANWNEQAKSLTDARRALNDTVRAVHRGRQPNRLSAYEAASELEGLREVPRIFCEFDEERALDATWLTDSESVMERLGPEFVRLGGARKPLMAVGTTDWPRARRNKLDQQLADLLGASAVLGAASAALEPWLPGLDQASGEELSRVDGLLETVRASPGPSLTLLEGAEERVEAWLLHVEKAVALAAKLQTRFQPTLLRMPLSKHEAKLRSWVDVPVLGWLVTWPLRHHYLTVVHEPPAPDGRLLRRTLAEAKQLLSERTAVVVELSAMGKLLEPLERDSWGLPRIDVDRTRELLDWTRELRERAKWYPQLLVQASRDADSTFAARADSFRSAWAEFQVRCVEAGQTLELSDEWAAATTPSYRAAVHARAGEIGGLLDSLRNWGAYSRTRSEALALGLGGIVSALEESRFNPDALPRVYRRSWLRWWLDYWTEHDSVLAAYDGNQQKDRERKFAKLDEKLRDLARDEVLARLSASQPHLDDFAPASSEAGILRRQFGRRAGFASPRKLFESCPTLIRQLKPCVLMSPQSVAQYLDPLHPPFDLVVFDEASQVPTHEAIGAIARGKQVIVVGDSQQLPPTMFFQDSDRESANDDDLMVELDSILAECRACGLDSLELAWHYRSRHPSLIAFSNRRYYRNRLQVLPAALAQTPHLGVSRVLVPNAVYDRGGTKVNLVEAEALVREVVLRLGKASKVLERSPDSRQPSLGVVTFSSPQQTLVEDLLEDACKRWPVIGPFFDADKHDEPVFVKNLENVQGDERDVILFSIGYGPDKSGRMTANLGPLGNEGGERRLNVAVTRARQRLIVFVSFETAQLDLSRTSAKGLHDLKAFLESAARGGEALVGSEELREDPASSALKQALARRIREAGHELDFDVGVGEYRIDLAVRHPEREGAYLLGIEIDDRRYAETPTARERDRLRWQVLRGLGWRYLYRMRGLEWYDDPESTVGEVLAILESSEDATNPFR